MMYHKNTYDDVVLSWRLNNSVIVPCLDLSLAVLKELRSEFFKLVWDIKLIIIAYHVIFYKFSFLLLNQTANQTCNHQVTSILS